jgi:hypothetical protein
MPKVYVLIDSFLGDLTLDIVACATKGAARIVKSMHRSTEYHDEPDLYGGAHVLDEAGVRKYLAEMSFGSDEDEEKSIFAGIDEVKLTNDEDKATAQQTLARLDAFLKSDAAVSVEEIESTEWESVNELHEMPEDDRPAWYLHFSFDDWNF